VEVVLLVPHSLKYFLRLNIHFIHIEIGGHFWDTFLKFFALIFSNYSCYRLETSFISFKRTELVRKDLKIVKNRKEKNRLSRPLALVCHALAHCAYYNFCSTRWDLSIDMGLDLWPSKDQNGVSSLNASGLSQGSAKLLILWYLCQCQVVLETTFRKAMISNRFSCTVTQKKLCINPGESSDE
jgi:hypothetical protein